MVNAPKAVIGLNETQLGIVAPLHFREPLAVVVGRRHAERLLQLGSLVTPEQAVAMGLVDEVKGSAEEVETAAVAAAAAWARVPAFAR